MKRSLWVTLLVLVLTACAIPQEAQVQAPTTDLGKAQNVMEPEETTSEVVIPTATRSPEVAQEAIAPPSPAEPLPTPTSPALPEVVAPTEETAPTQVDQVLGPDAFPEDYNPLTGLPVEDPALLGLSPALVSVSNFPVTARPQAGLSFAPYVFEMSIGEGMTRFLALFYGAYPQANDEGTGSSLTRFDETAIGPVRSGRLPYESLRQLYNGFVVMASAYRAVGAQLGTTTNVYGSDEDDINSAMIDVAKLKEIAEANSSRQRGGNLSGNLFSTQAPEGGSAANRLWVFYSFLNQVDWRYDPDSGAYLRFQDNADGSGEFTPATDRLTGEQLGFENVVVLLTKHHVLNSEGTLIDVDLLYTGGKAVLFRDGMAYPILWNTMNGEYEKSSGLLRPVRFTDLEGKPIALKPGQTWVEMIDTTTTIEEIEPGTWKARFYAP